MNSTERVTVRIPGGKAVESALSGETLSADGIVQASFHPFELKAWRVK
jgi:hypothetical protein